MLEDFLKSIMLTDVITPITDKSCKLHERLTCPLYYNVAFAFKVIVKLVLQ